MVIHIISIISVFFILYLYLHKASSTVYLKKLVLPFTCLLFILSLIVFSEKAVNSASKGIRLWLDIVFPSLFPFFVASELLSGSGFVRFAGRFFEPLMRPVFNVPGCGSFAFIMGVTGGYPVGAKITVEMKKKDLLSKAEAERLLAFSNNSGPLFIVGAVSVGIFKMPQIGIFLLSCHIAACITVGILFRFYKKDKELTEKTHKPGNSGTIIHQTGTSRNQVTNSMNLGAALGDAVKNSIMTLLSIGGFIILFSVIINLLLETGMISEASKIISMLFAPAGAKEAIITSILSGFIEITTGTAMVGNLTGVPLLSRLAAASMIIGWAGLSVHSQVLGIVSGTGIDIRPYILGKFLQGVFASLYTIAGIKIAGSVVFNSKQAFAPAFFENMLYRHDYLTISAGYLFTALAIIAAAIVCSYIACFAADYKTNN